MMVKNLGVLSVIVAMFFGVQSQGADIEYDLHLIDTATRYVQSYQFEMADQSLREVEFDLRSLPPSSEKGSALNLISQARFNLSSSGAPPAYKARVVTDLLLQVRQVLFQIGSPNPNPGPYPYPGNPGNSDLATAFRLVDGAQHAIRADDYLTAERQLRRALTYMNYDDFKPDVRRAKFYIDRTQRALYDLQSGYGNHFALKRAAMNEAEQAKRYLRRAMRGFGFDRYEDDRNVDPRDDYQRDEFRINPRVDVQEVGTSLKLN